MIFLAILAAILGAVCFAVLFRYTGLLGTSLMTLLVGTCCGHAFFHVSAGPLPITADRVLVGILVVGYLVYRRFGFTQVSGIHKMDIVAIAFVCIVGLSTFLHDWKLNGAQPVATWLFFFVLPLPLYWVVRGIRLGDRAIRGLFLTFACFGVYLACTAICEKFQVYSFVFPRYITSGEYVEFYGRGRGPLLNPIGNGLLILLALFSAIMLWPHGTRVQQFVLTALMPIYLAGAYCTLTRSVWVGCVAGLFLIAAVNLPTRYRAGFAYATILCGALLIAMKSGSLNSFKRDKDVSVSDMSKSVSLRPVLAAVAWKMFQDHPVLGVGLGQYKREAVYYLHDRTTEMNLELARPYVQHNVFLAILTENGIIGLVLFLMLIGLWGVTGWQIWRQTDESLAKRQVGLLMLAYLVAYCINGMFHDVSIIPMMNMFLFFLGGVIRSLAVQRAASTSNLDVPFNRGVLQSSQRLSST